MNTALTDFQDRFARGLMADQDRGDLNLRALMQQPGFRVYRNTVMKGLVDALQANYPAVLRLLGEEFFRAVAALYVAQYPATDARLLQYGVHFPAFLQDFAPARPWPYLASVARLDRCWTEVHIAADAPVTSAEYLASQIPDALAQLILRPHPAARWHWFDDLPVFTLWQRSRNALNEDDAIDWQSEGALITRPHGAVRWAALTRVGCDLLDLCQSPRPFIVQLQQLQAMHPTADCGALTAMLLRAGALTCFNPALEPH